MLLGLLVSVLRYIEIPILSQVLNWLITIFREIPLAVFLYLMYFLVTEIIFNSQLLMNNQFIMGNSAEISIIITYSTTTLINSSEIFLSSLNSVETSQIEAARTLGFRTRQIFNRNVLPQAITISLPMLGNLIIGIIKGTSLVAMFGVAEILLGALYVAEKNYSYLEAYLVAALIYWALALIIEFITEKIENRQQKRYGVN